MKRAIKATIKVEHGHTDSGSLARQFIKAVYGMSVEQFAAQIIEEFGNQEAEEDK